MKRFLFLFLAISTAHAGEGGVGTTGGGDFAVVVEGWRSHLPADVEAYSVSDIISRPTAGQRWWQGIARQCRARGGRPGVFGLTRTEERTTAQYVEIRFRGLRPATGEPQLIFWTNGISDGERNPIPEGYPFESCLDGSRDLQIFWNGHEMPQAELQRRLDALRSLADTSVNRDHPAQWALLAEHDRWAVPLARAARLPVVSLVDRSLQSMMRLARGRSLRITQLASQAVDASGQCREGPFMEIRRVLREWAPTGRSVYFRQLQEHAGIPADQAELQEAARLYSDAVLFVDQEVYGRCDTYYLFATQAETIDSLLSEGNLEAAYESLRQLRSSHRDPRVVASIRQRMDRWTERYTELLFQSLADRLAAVRGAEHLARLRPRFEEFSEEWIGVLGRAAPGAVDLISGTVALDALLFPPDVMRLFLLHELIHLNDPCANGSCTQQVMETRAWRETFRMIDRIAAATREPVPLLFQEFKRQVRVLGIEAWVRGILHSR